MGLLAGVRAHDQPTAYFIRSLRPWNRQRQSGLPGHQMFSTSCSNMWIVHACVCVCARKPLWQTVSSSLKQFSRKLECRGTGADLPIHSNEAMSFRWMSGLINHLYLLQIKTVDLCWLPVLLVQAVVSYYTFDCSTRPSRILRISRRDHSQHTTFDLKQTSVRLLMYIVYKNKIL